MFKPIFVFLTEPLGLPIAWYWEYIILFTIGVIAYKIAYSKVGDMYRADLIQSKTVGSFFHWLIRISIFFIIWAITYGVIWVGKLILANWQMVLLFVSIGIVLFLACVFLYFTKQRMGFNRTYKH